MRNIFKRKKPKLEQKTHVQNVSSKQNYEDDEDEDLIDIEYIEGTENEEHEIINPKKQYYSLDYFFEEAEKFASGSDPDSSYEDDGFNPLDR